jgi:hypothetical protein
MSEVGLFFVYQLVRCAADLIKVGHCNDFLCNPIKNRNFYYIDK